MATCEPCERNGFTGWQKTITDFCTVAKNLWILFYRNEEEVQRMSHDGPFSLSKILRA
jgi:hypothetical protein